VASEDENQGCKFTEWAGRRKTASDSASEDPNKVIRQDRVILREYEKVPKDLKIAEAQWGIPDKVAEDICKAIHSGEDQASSYEGSGLRGDFNPFSACGKPGEHYYRPAGQVGIFPFMCSQCGRPHMVVVAPKVASNKSDRIDDALAGLCDMAALARQNPSSDRSELPRWFHFSGEVSWTGAGLGADVWLMIALQYVFGLERLLRLDYRRYYVPRSETLSGRVKGRLMTGRYLQMWMAGRPTELPCRWHDFTFDNWDNRILETALTECSRLASPESDFANFIHSKLHSGTFQASFDEVSDVHPWELEWASSKLSAVSPHYRDCLATASQILANRGGGSTSSPVLRPTWIDTNDLFEDFVAAMVAEAARKAELKCVVQGEGEVRRLFSKENSKVGRGPETKPDAIVIEDKAVRLVVDAKYKDLDPGENTDEALEGVDQDQGKNGDDATPRTVNADMFQMFFYLMSRKCHTGVIVFPFWKPGSPDAAHEYKKAARTFNVKTALIGGEKPEVPPEVRFIGLNLAKDVHTIFESGSAILEEMIKNAQIEKLQIEKLRNQQKN